MTAFDPEKITFFAKTDARGQGVAFGIKAKDRQRHMYVVGKTGMGKSTLLENMAAQDIMNGEGMAFIDPHGSAAETLLSYVPEHRVKDVVYFAPFDLEYPISFNVMEDVGPEKRHLVVSGLMSTFKKIWVDAWSARMEYILTNALLALIEYPDTTLLSVNRLFSDKAYRERVVEYCKDPAVKSFWVDEFANYTDRFTADALPAIQNKVGQFTGNPLIRNIIGQPHSSFDFRKLMDEKKIILMNLSKGLIGETNANLLGSMLTTRIYLAAMSRADLSVDVMKTMPNFYFYVDEFQSFANATFANILSEARKYHLNLIIAHQYIEQMEEDVRNAVFGNVGTTIAFRVGPFDAEVLETVFSPRFVATDLVNLGFAQIYLTLMINGIGSQPFSAQTLPPVKAPPVSCRDMVIAASRQTYAKRREDVEKVVADLHTPIRSEVESRSADKRPVSKFGPNREVSNGNGGARRFETSGAMGAKRPEVFGRDRTERPERQERTDRPEKARSEPADRNRNERPPREEPSARSVEDLRGVLARLAKQTNEQTEEQEPAVSPTKAMAEPSGGKAVERPVAKEKELERGSAARREEVVRPQHSDSSDRGRMPTQVPAKKPATDTSSLRNALAAAVRLVDGNVSTLTKDKTDERTTPGLPEASLPATPAPLTPAPNTPPIVPPQTSGATPSGIRKIVIEHRRQPATTVLPQPAPLPPAAASTPPQGPDPAEVKRIFRQDDGGRSPFQ